MRVFKTLFACLFACACAVDVYNPVDPVNPDSWLLQASRTNTESVVGADPTTSAASIVLFATTGTSTGALGGRGGADATCVAARAGSTFAPINTCAAVRALVSFTGTDEIADMAANYSVPSTRPIIGPTGLLVATNWADLLDGSIGMSLQSAGVLPTSNFWWSFSSGATAALHPNSCANGTSGLGGQTGSYGRSDMTNTQWMDNAPVPCDASTLAPDPHLLCVCY